MSNLLRQVFVLVYHAEDLLHKLASRRIDSLGLLIKFFVHHRLNSLTHDELERSVHDHLDVLVCTEIWGDLIVWTDHQLVTFLELVRDVRRVLLSDAVLDKLFLGCKNDVPQLCEIFDHDARIVVVHKEELS